MIASGLLLIGSMLVGQTVDSYGPRVARNSNDTATDIVYWEAAYGSPNAVVHWRVGGAVDSPSLYPGTSSPISPDVDNDDDTNYVVAFTAYDSGGGSGVYLAANAGPAVQVGHTLDGTNYFPGSFARVSISRTGGKVAVMWLGGDNIGYRAVNSGAVYAQTFQLSGQTLSATSDPIVVNLTSSGYGSYSTYASGDVSCDDAGNFVVTYVRDQAGGSLQPGYFATLVGADAAVRFLELVIEPFPGQNHYAYIEVSCNHAGDFAAIYNSGGGSLKSVWVSVANQPAPVVGTPVVLVDNSPGSLILYGGTYPEHFSVATLRGATNSYAVTWDTSLDPNGHGMPHGANVIYQEIRGGAPSPPVFKTFSTLGNSEATDYYGAPTVAMSDAGHVIIPYESLPVGANSQVIALLDFAF